MPMLGQTIQVMRRWLVLERHSWEILKTLIRDGRHSGRKRKGRKEIKGVRLHGSAVSSEACQREEDEGGKRGRGWKTRGGVKSQTRKKQNGFTLILSFELKYWLTWQFFRFTVNQIGSSTGFRLQLRANLHNYCISPEHLHFTARIASQAQLLYSVGLMHLRCWEICE